MPEPFPETALSVIPSPPEWADPWRHPEYYAGVTLKRIIAYAADLLFVAVIGFFVWFLSGMLGLLTLGLLMPLHVLAVALVPFAYHTLLIGGERSATFGMRAMGLKVMSIAPDSPESQSHGRPTLFQAMIQTVCFYGSLLATGSLILAVALFNPRRRTVHDFLAGTVVVNDLTRPTTRE